MGFDEMKKKGKDALGDEEKSDEYLDKGSDFINEKTGGKHADKVKRARDFLDDRIGDEDESSAGSDQGGRGQGQ